MKLDHPKSIQRDFATSLKKAREAKGLSQRDLSAKIDIPQSHISKIESGKVDIQISSLIELTRALDLEIMFVPRSFVAAVEAITQPSGKPQKKVAADTTLLAPKNDPAEQIHYNLEKASKDAMRLSRSLPAPELSRLAEAARSLDRLRIPQFQFQRINDALSGVAHYQEILRDAVRIEKGFDEALKNVNASKALQEIARSADYLRSIRNTVAHGSHPATARVRPAYRLSDGDDDA